MDPRGADRRSKESVMIRSASRFSLRTHLLLLILVILGPAFALTLSSSLEVRRHATADVREQVLRLARRTSLQQEQLIVMARQLLITVGRLPEVRRGDAATCSAFAADLLADQRFLTNLGVIGMDGTVICSGVPLAGPVNLADRLYFQQARASRTFAVGDYQLGRVTGKATLGFGYPILDQADQVTGIVFASMDLEWLQALVVEAQLPEGSYLVVVDHGGMVLSRYPDPHHWVGRSLVDTPLGQALLSQHEGIAQSAGLDGIEHLYAFTAFTPLGHQPEAPAVSLAVGVPAQVAYAAAEHALRRSLIILGVISALTLVLALIASDLLIQRPIQALLTMTSRLGTGDLSTRALSASGIRELGHLATAFDQMADALEQREAARSQLEGQLAHQAFYDPLTELPNRALLLDRLTHALAAAERPGTGLAVLFLDLDRFKVVNDSLGHTGGDALLHALGERLTACVRGGDTVARWGGDEFVALIQGPSEAGVAEDVADRIMAGLARPFIVAGREVIIGASIGITHCSYPSDHTTAEDLIREADIALHWAKVTGKGRIVVFDPSMQTTALTRLEDEADLRRALALGQLHLQYQPIVALATGRLEVVEALVRWEHPTRGLISPADFIPLAEETGLIVPLGQWVLEEACRQMRVWQQQFATTAPAVMSVNLSVRQFRNVELVQTIRDILERTGLAAACLKLEITESALMDDVEATITKLLELKGLGISLAIDDFGTGYSSLNALKRLPVDTLKIDRSFVQGLGKDPQDAAIVRSIITLAQSLRLSVTAEGIETEQQRGKLWAFGCDHGQGYYFARPLASEALEALLTTDLNAVQLPSTALWRPAVSIYQAS
jgi:diguanylate cyclase (GGDEF)-like protein